MYYQAAGAIYLLLETKTRKKHPGKKMIVRLKQKVTWKVKQCVKVVCLLTETELEQ